MLLENIRMSELEAAEETYYNPDIVIIIHFSAFSLPRLYLVSCFLFVLLMRLKFQRSSGLKLSSKTLQTANTKSAISEFQSTRVFPSSRSL